MSALRTVGLIVLLGLGACGGSGMAEVEPAVQAARIAAEIQAAPDDVAKILAKHQMTEEAFEDLLYDIAADAEASKAYAAALGR